VRDLNGWGLKLIVDDQMRARNLFHSYIIVVFKALESHDNLGCMRVRDRDDKIVWDIVGQKRSYMVKASGISF
jgi:hypothetical protein